MPRRRRTSIKLRERSRRGIMLLLAGGGLTLLAILLAGPVKRYFQKAEAESQLALARAALEHRAWAKALHHAGAALQAQPGHGAALHLAADAFHQLGGHPDEVLNLLTKAKAAGQTQPEVDLKLAQAQLRRGNLSAAQSAFNHVPPAARSGWLAAEVEAALLLAQGQEPAVAAQLRERLEADPTAPGAAFRLAVLDLSAPSPARCAAAKERLMQEARSDSVHAPQAMHLLLQLRDLQATQARELAFLARKIPDPVGTELRYAALSTLLRLEVPALRVALINAEAADVSKLGPEAAFRFLLFLAANREPEAMHNFIQPRRQLLAAIDVGQLFQLELEALAQSRQWPIVAEKLKSPDASRLEPWSRHLWSACAEAAATSPDRQQVRLSLEAAFEATERGRHAKHALYIADTAVLLGHHDFALICYEMLLQKMKLPAEQIALLEKIDAALVQTPDAGSHLRFARHLAALIPGHAAHAFRVRYLELLINPSPATLNRVDNENPTPPDDADATHSARHRLLQAMVQYRRQHLLGAIVMDRRREQDSLQAELRGLEHAIPWPPGPRAVIAGLLAYTGETARAFQVAEKVPAALLLPEEMRMLEMAR